MVNGLFLQLVADRVKGLTHLGFVPLHDLIHPGIDERGLLFVWHSRRLRVQLRGDHSAQFG